MDYISQKLGLLDMEEWYSVTRAKVVELGGTGIISHFGSLAGALKSTYPEYEWILGRFAISPKGTWDDDDNIRGFFDDTALKLGIRETDDWYKVSRDDVDKLGGRELINRYGGLERALRHIYFEHNWISGRFSYVPRNSWSQQSSVMEFLDYLRDKLGIRNNNDWYRISAEQIMSHGGAGMYMKFGTLGHALRFAYPDTDWSIDNFSVRDKRTRQRYCTILI